MESAAPTSLLAMLDKLEDFIATTAADDGDPDYNMAIGAASALRYAIDGYTDATLVNLLAVIDAA